MLPNFAVPDLSEALAAVIERQVLRRTWGRVRRLRVEAGSDRVRVRGSVPSYYVKQLVIQGALDVLGSLETPRLDVDVDVDDGALSSRHAWVPS